MPRPDEAPPSGAAAPRTAPNPQRGIAAYRATLDGLRVLVVDDNVDCLDLLCLALSRVGISVARAESAAQARDMLGSFDADVLVSDLSMPDESGFDLVRTVRAARNRGGESLHAVALSAHARQEDRAKAYAAGFDVHLPKPVDLFTLLDTLGRFARRAS